MAESISKKELGDTHQQLLETVTKPSSLGAIAQFYTTKKRKLAKDFATKAVIQPGNKYDAMPLLELELSSKFTVEDRIAKLLNITRNFQDLGYEFFRVFQKVRLLAKKMGTHVSSGCPF